MTPDSRPHCLQDSGTFLLLCVCMARDVSVDATLIASNAPPCSRFGAPGRVIKSPQCSASSSCPPRYAIDKTDRGPVSYSPRNRRVLLRPDEVLHQRQDEKRGERSLEERIHSLAFCSGRHTVRVKQDTWASRGRDGREMRAMEPVA